MKVMGDWEERRFLKQALRITRPITQGLKIEKLPLVEPLDSVRKTAISYFFGRVKKVPIELPSDPSAFYNLVAKIWSYYIRSIYYMDKLVQHFTPFYLRKAKVALSLWENYHRINLLAYRLGEHEKEYQKNKEGKELKIALPYPPSYFAQFAWFQEQDELLEEITLGNEELKRKLLERSKQGIPYKNIHYPKLYGVPEKIAFLDHFLEASFRLEGLVLLDVRFYSVIARFLNKRTYQEALEGLRTYIKRKEKSFRYTIPRFIQRYGSCGVTSMANAMAVFRPFKFTKKLEKEWMERSLHSPYPGNMPYLMAEIAREQGFPVELFWDKESYLAHTSDSHLERYARSSGLPFHLVKEVKEKFVEGMKDATNFRGNWNNWVKKRLQEGGLVIFANERQGILHYNLIYGYDEEGFFIWDPLGWEEKSSDLNKTMRNSISVWGLVIYDPFKLEEIEHFLNEVKNDGLFKDKTGSKALV